MAGRDLIRYFADENALGFAKLLPGPGAKMSSIPVTCSFQKFHSVVMMSSGWTQLAGVAGSF